MESQHIASSELINTARNEYDFLACNSGSGSIKLLFSGKEEISVEGNIDELINHYREYLQKHRERSVVLHRVVHGGRASDILYPIDKAQIEHIEHWGALAPLHNKTALKLIEVTKNIWPASKQFVIFDTSLYRDLPKVAQTYPIPVGLSKDWPILRYGFHGIAHRAQFRMLCAQGDYPRVITIHLGGGSSITAWKNNRVIDTTMGFTPTDGLPMTTRSGELDPMIVLHLIKREGYTVEQLETLLNQESGLKGISGISGDYRDLKEIDQEEAKLAREYFCRNLTKGIGSMLALLGGVDAISFGGGLAENQREVRAACLAPLAPLGIILCRKKNRIENSLSPLHSDNSITDIWLTPAGECEEMVRQYQQSNFFVEEVC